MKIGDVFNEETVSIMRPGNGLEPEYMKKLLGKKFTKKVDNKTMISLDDFMVE